MEVQCMCTLKPFVPIVHGLHVAQISCNNSFVQTFHSAFFDLSVVLQQSHTLQKLWLFYSWRRRRWYLAQNVSQRLPEQ